MKLFAFFLYTCGMFTYLGMMLMESTVTMGAVKALSAIPASQQALPTTYFLDIRVSWVGMLSSMLINLVFWVLWIGMSLLLFDWKRPVEIATE